MTQADQYAAAIERDAQGAAARLIFQRQSADTVRARTSGFRDAERARPPHPEWLQLPLLDPEPEPLPPVRDQRVPAARRRHLSEQSRRILERLEEGPVANVELARMFPPTTAWRTRLSDVRWELRRRCGLTSKQDPVPGYDCGYGIVWHWIEETPR